MSTENKRDERQSHREANKERVEQEGRANNVPQLQDAAKEQAPDGVAKGLDTEDASLAFEEEARVQVAVEESAVEDPAAVERPRRGATLPWSDPAAGVPAVE